MEKKRQRQVLNKRRSEKCKQITSLMMLSAINAKYDEVAKNICCRRRRCCLKRLQYKLKGSHTPKKIACHQKDYESVWCLFSNFSTLCRMTLAPQPKSQRRDPISSCVLCVRVISGCKHTETCKSMPINPYSVHLNYYSSQPPIVYSSTDPTTEHIVSHFRESKKEKKDLNC